MEQHSPSNLSATPGSTFFDTKQQDSRVEAPDTELPAPSQSAEPEGTKTPGYSNRKLFQYFAWLKKDTPPEFPPRSWTEEGVRYGGTEGSESVPFYPKPTERSPSVPPTAESEEHAPDPLKLADRIRKLVGLLPDDPAEANETTSPTVFQLVDERLRSLLTSETVMNGVKGVPSVWSLLDRMRPARATETDEKDEDEGSEPDSVMMYMPLHPENDSEPELASVSEGSEEEQTDGAPTTDQEPTAENVEEKRAKIWVPSPEKISIEARYWGFRIYLPPPVMSSLDAAQPLATKQAAMITASLKWALAKIPLALAPPSLRPAFMLLKRLVPYVGSIGVFIAWSWSAIKKHDKGQGVVLSASWLLPVALVPSSWPESTAMGENTVVTDATVTQDEPLYLVGLSHQKTKRSRKVLRQRQPGPKSGAEGR